MAETFLLPIFVLFYVLHAFNKFLRRLLILKSTRKAGGNQKTNAQKSKLTLLLIYLTPSSLSQRYKKNIIKFNFFGLWVFVVVGIV